MFKLGLCSTLAVLFLASHITPLNFNSLITKRKKSNFSVYLKICQGGSNEMVYMESNGK